MKGQAALEALLLAACLLAAIAVLAGAFTSVDWGARSEEAGSAASSADCLGIEALAGHARAAANFSPAARPCLVELRPGGVSELEGANEKR